MVTLASAGIADLGDVSEITTYFGLYNFVCWSTRPGWTACADDASGVIVGLTGDPTVHVNFASSISPGERSRIDVLATWIGRFLGSRGITDSRIVDWLANEVFTPMALSEPVDSSFGVGELFLHAKWDPDGLPIAQIVLAIRGHEDELTPTETVPTAAAARCEIPLRTMADLASCDGESQLFDETPPINDSRQILRIAITSRDPTVIAAGLADVFRRHWSSLNELTIFGYGSEGDYLNGSPYNRGRLVTHPGIAEFAICTEWYEPSIDTCSAETTFSVPLDQ